MGLKAETERRFHHQHHPGFCRLLQLPGTGNITVKHDAIICVRIPQKHRKRDVEELEKRNDTTVSSSTSPKAPQKKSGGNTKRRRTDGFMINSPNAPQKKIGGIKKETKRRFHYQCHQKPRKRKAEALATRNETTVSSSTVNTDVTVSNGCQFQYGGKVPYGFRQIVATRGGGRGVVHPYI